jgi:hypothetical protein
MWVSELVVEKADQLVVLSVDDLAEKKADRMAGW